MWPLVREGLRVYRPVLVIAWTSCTLGIVAVFAVLAMFGVVDFRRALLLGASAWSLYMLLACAIPGWIAIGTEQTEHRLRLHLTLPLSLRQVAFARLLLPTALLALGLPLAHGGVALVQAFEPTTWSRHGYVALVAAHLSCLHQLSFAAKEVSLLREASWWKAAFGWLVILVLLNVELAMGFPPGLGAARAALVTALALFVAGLTMVLFLRRTELAR